MAVTTQQLWNLSKEFIKDSGLVRQHIDSYDDLSIEDFRQLLMRLGNYQSKSETIH